jgi:hypothetical protein
MANSPTTPEVGKTYIVNHSRKGRFTAKVHAINGEWADLEIVAGRADAMLPENRAGKGEGITVRLSFCTFTPTGGA